MVNMDSESQHCLFSELMDTEDYRDINKSFALSRSAPGHMLKDTNFSWRGIAMFVGGRNQ